VSDVQDRRGGEPTPKGATAKAADTTAETKGGPGKGPSNKAVRRAALQKAAAKRAVAKRRRNFALSVLAAVAVLGVIVAVFQAAGKPKSPNASDAGASASASGELAAPGEQPTPASTAKFPPLPAGADPALGTKPAVTAGTGPLTKLTVTPIIEGTGAPVQAGQNVTANYVGVSYTDGKEFDSSWKRSEPIAFPIGAGRVIKGWDQGLVGVKIGSRVQLDIPPALAYGDTGGPVPGPLRFVVDVLAAE